jgi:hypothetical protein
MGILSRAESLANRVVTWLTLFGFLSAGLAWLSSNLTMMRGFGWADFVAVGIGSAVVIMLALAAVLSAWRMFMPFSNSRGLTDTTPSPFNGAGPKAIERRLTIAQSDLAILTEKVEAAQSDMAKVAKRSDEKLDALGRDTAASLAKQEKQLPQRLF